MPARRYFSSEHLQSPYSRGGPNSGPQSPHPSRTIVPKTPGSIFSKVRQMFSPTSWLPTESNTANNSILNESDNSAVSVTQDPPNASKQSAGLRTPSNPFNEFKRLQGQLKGEESPNVKLANFFASKGADPLSEVELEGVQALLSKSHKTNGSPKTPSSLSISEEDETNNSLLEKDYDNKLLTNDNFKHALNTTPSFKATYNTSVSEADTSNISTVSNTTSAFKRRVFDYNGFPSPYRTSRLKSSFSVNDLRGHVPSSLKNEIKDEEEKPEPKKLSNTATALLSFIENSESDSSKIQDEEEEQTKSHKIQDFTNPYASTRKSKKLHRSAIKKQSAIEQLEKSLNAQEEEEENQKPTPTATSIPTTSTTTNTKVINQVHQSESLNKYKPTKSSSLRESISLNDENDENSIKVPSIIEEDKKTEKKQQNPLPSFSFTSSTPSVSQNARSPKQSSAFSFGASSDAKVSSEPKPAFDFGSKESNETKSEPKQQPLFSFGSKPSTEAPSSGFSFNSKSKETDVETIEIDDKDADKSLTIKPSAEIASNKEESKPFKKNAQPLFKFPNAEDLGYTLKDIDANKTLKYKDVFTF